MRPLLIVCSLIVLAGCAKKPEAPVYGRVPHFSLTSQNSEKFDSASLAGKLWVADFFFTRCMGPCPRMSAQMNWVQKQTADVRDLRLVSFSIDPEHDTPPVLAEYAVRYRATAGRWFFLTGATSAIHDLCRNAFKLGDLDGSMMHSTRFVLIDGKGQIRGYYRTEEGETLAPLIADIRRLSSESGVATASPLPAVNATLNGTAAVLLVAGFILIRRGKKRAHKRVMLAAFAASVLFLIGYLVYHAQVGSVRYPGSGALRTTYLAILLTHTLLAAAVPPLALISLSRGLRGRFDKHRAIARWTLPIWLYVSVTGVIVYLMLYQLPH